MNGMSREEIDGRFVSSQATTDARIQALLERMDSVMVQSVEREARFNLQFASAMEAIRDIRATIRDFRAEMRDMRADIRHFRVIIDAAVNTMRSLARNVVIAVAVSCVSTGVATVFGVAAVNASISSSMLAAIETGSNMSRNQEEFRRQVGDISKSQSQFERQMAGISKSQAQFERQMADVSKSQAQFERQMADVSKSQAQFERRMADISRSQAQLERKMSDMAASLRKLERRLPPAPPR